MLINMKKIVCLLIFLTFSFGYAQKQDLALQKSNDYVYQGNELLSEDFISAEMEYRKAISKNPSNAIGTYNLGNAYYKNGKFSEAIIRHQEAIKSAVTKEEKHMAYHNIGNTLMQNKQCKEAVEAYKNALRNNPNDDETRYNLGLAKECAKEEGGGGDDQNDDQEQNEDQQNEDNKEKQDEGDNKEDKKDEGDQDENEGDQEEDDQGQPKDEKEDKGKGEDEKKEQKPKPRQGQLSPQQIKNLLEAMNDQEKQVQEKINAQKAKGINVQTDKDW